MTPEERDGCIYCRAGVICRFPAIYGGVPPKCKCCGWNPAIQPARKAQARERLRRKVKIKLQSVKREGNPSTALRMTKSGGGETK